MPRKNNVYGGKIRGLPETMADAEEDSRPYTVYILMGKDESDFGESCNIPIRFKTKKTARGVFARLGMQIYSREEGMGAILENPYNE